MFAIIATYGKRLQQSFMKLSGYCDHDTVKQESFEAGNFRGF